MVEMGKHAREPEEKRLSQTGRPAKPNAGSSGAAQKGSLTQNSLAKLYDRETGKSDRFGRRS